MLVTNSGVEWMTRNLPRSVADIEAFMAKASKQMNNAVLPKIENPNLAVLAFENNFFNDADRYSFTSNITSSGKTVRRGWISVGKETALNGLRHAETHHSIE